MSKNLKLTASEHDEIARDLHLAIKEGSGAALPSENKAFTMDDAYQIRRKLVDLLINDGGIPCGHKIGFTSKVMQEMYGMNGPDFGQLLDNMFVPYGEKVVVSNLSDTRVEPEIAFEMSSGLSGVDLTIEEVLDKTARIYPAIEIIDSRVGAMRATAVDSIADNAGAGKVVLGPQSFDPKKFNLEELKVVLQVDDAELVGFGCDVMEHPANPVGWLASKLNEINGLGGSINSGDIIISGSFTKSVEVKKGSILKCSFGPLGEMELNFT